MTERNFSGPNPSIKITEQKWASQNTRLTLLKTTCFSNENYFYTDLMSIFKNAKLAILLTETSDLFLSKSDFDAKMADPKTTLVRLGIMGEDIGKLQNALTSLVHCQMKGGDIIELKIMENTNHDNKILNVFLVLKMKVQDNVNAVLRQRETPYYMWKRLHLRIYYRRGAEGYQYRWTANENDDDGNFKIPAEAFEKLDEVSPVDPKDALILAPKDKDFFVWQKKGSEFKECNKTNMEQHRTHKKGKALTDKKKIDYYMKSIITIKRLMARLRIFSWLNCGTLLGWWRQCSIIPNDPDIDMLHWNSMDKYPVIVKELLDRPQIFTIKKMYIDYGPFKRVPGGQEGLYLKVLVAGGQIVDLYFNYERKIYDTRHYELKTFKSFDFTDNVCSADLHGFLVYVPCTEKKIHEYNVLHYGPNYMDPK